MLTINSLFYSFRAHGDLYIRSHSHLPVRWGKWRNDFNEREKCWLFCQGKYQIPFCIDSDFKIHNIVPRMQWIIVFDSMYPVHPVRHETCEQYDILKFTCSQSKTHSIAETMLHSEHTRQFGMFVCAHPLPTIYHVRLSKWYVSPVHIGMSFMLSICLSYTFRICMSDGTTRKSITRRQQCATLISLDINHE